MCRSCIFIDTIIFFFRFLPPKNFTLKIRLKKFNKFAVVCRVVYTKIPPTSLKLNVFFNVICAKYWLLKN